MTHYVYRFFDDNDQLLYVGESKCPISRAASHRAESPWFWRVAHWRIDIHVSRADALAAEYRAIRIERPLFNVNGLSAHDYVTATERVAAERLIGQPKKQSIPLPQWVGQGDHRAESAALVEALRRNHEADRCLREVKEIETTLRSVITTANDVFALVAVDVPVGSRRRVLTRSFLSKWWSHG